MARPDRPSRGFELSLAALILASGAGTALAGFSDVAPDHWARPAIDRAARAGILEGFDGTFQGERLVSRYHAAVVAARLLDAHARGTAAPADASRLVTAMEPLAERLELQTRDVRLLLSRAEGVESLRAAVAAVIAEEEAKAPPADDSSTFGALLSVGLVGTDDRDAGRTRWAGTDDWSFEVPQVSLGVDADLSLELSFHLQLDFDATVNGTGDEVSINEAYVVHDFLAGQTGVKLGAFASPFALELRGPFRTTDLTVTPSVLTTLLESIRLYGLEILPSAPTPGSLTVHAGIGSGTDSFSAWGRLWRFDDTPARINGGGEGDEGLGRYLALGQQGRSVGTGSVTWQLGWFDNDGDITPAPGFSASPETDFLVAGLQVRSGRTTLLAQMADGTSRVDAVRVEDWRASYALLDVGLGRRHSLALRYDSWDREDQTGQTQDSGGAITVALNARLRDRNLLQIEYLSPDPGGVTDDWGLDLVQIRYKVSF